jgi:hypothetical protein
VIGTGAIGFVNGGFVGAAFFHYDLLRHAMLTHRLFEELLDGSHVTMRRQEEIDGLPFKKICKTKEFRGCVENAKLPQ